MAASRSYLVIVFDPSGRDDDPNRLTWHSSREAAEASLTDVSAAERWWVYALDLKGPDAKLLCDGTGPPA